MAARVSPSQEITDMDLNQAKAECQRWLDYLERQKEKSVAMQQLASDRRLGKCTADEARRRLSALDSRCSVTVYDGAKLADAVKVLMKSRNA